MRLLGAAVPTRSKFGTSKPHIPSILVSKPMLLWRHILTTKFATAIKQRLHKDRTPQRGTGRNAPPSREKLQFLQTPYLLSSFKSTLLRKHKPASSSLESSRLPKNALHSKSGVPHAKAGNLHLVLPTPVLKSRACYQPTVHDKNCSTDVTRTNKNHLAPSHTSARTAVAMRFSSNHILNPNWWPVMLSVLRVQ